MLAKCNIRAGLILTRPAGEKPEEIAYQEGRTSPVRTLFLQGLKEEEGQQVLEDKDYMASKKIYARWSGSMRGIPGFATGGRNGQRGFRRGYWQFLTAGGGLCQYQPPVRSALSTFDCQEQEILYWLAIEREAVSLATLREDLVYPLTRQMLPDTLKSLLRRSLVENRGSALFTLQPVIMEYVTMHLIELFAGSLETDTTEAWEKYALLKAQPETICARARRSLFLGLSCNVC